MEFINLLKSWDKDLFLYLNGIHSPLWDYSMTLFTLTPNMASLLWNNSFHCREEIR